MNVSRDFFISTFLILPKCDLMKSCYCFESLLQMQLMFGKLIADIARFMLTADCLLKLINTLNNDSKCWSEFYRSNNITYLQIILHTKTDLPLFQI